MLTKEQARELVERYLTNEVSGYDGEFAVVDDATIETTFGWVFVYDSSEYLKTGDEMSRAVGNAPVLVDKRNGELHVTGTGMAIDHYIAMYERHGTCHPES